MQNPRERMPAPAALMEALRTRDEVALALDVLHAIESLEPVDVPQRAVISVELAQLMDGPARTVPEHLQDEHKDYIAARDARANAKIENKRRLRSLLWAEQCLRKNGRDEHEVLRAFNRDAWGVNESASRSIAEREEQVKAHA